MVFEFIVLTLLLPALVSAAVVFCELLAGGTRASGTDVDRAAWLAGGVAAAGSFFLAYSLFSWTKIYPDDFWHWLPQAVVALTFATLLTTMAVRAWARVVILVVAGVFAWLMTPAWENVADFRWLSALRLAAAMILYLALLQPLRNDRRAKQVWLIGVVLTLHLIAAAIVVERSGWLSLAQLIGVAITAFSTLTIANWLYPGRQFLYGAIPTFAVVFPATLMLAWYYTYSSISLGAFVLTALGPIAQVAMLVITRRASRWVQIAAFLSPLVLPLAGVILAFATT